MLLPHVVVKGITIRTHARTVKSHFTGRGGAKFEGQKNFRGELRRLLFLDFPDDERLNDGPQEFLGNHIHHLRAHLVEYSLDDRFNHRAIGFLRRGGCWRRELSFFGILRRSRSNGSDGGGWGHGFSRGRRNGLWLDVCG